MKTSHSARLQSLFASALELEEPARTQFVERECGDDAALLRELRVLLAADAKVAELTAPPLLAEFSDALAALAPGALLAGTRVGAFELGAELGRGGMGRVYRARRVDGVIEQDVAIKFVRRELLDANTIRRFQLERQLMATLDHPHIARLIDAAELEDGTPYYVMEYVAGEPITEHCEHAQLDLRARVELLRKVCEAVAEAHRKLVVHRDLKPGNILVTANGTPKLLDFGISKPLDAPGNVETTGTAERYFSPQYAAPEQVTGEPVGVACDVYALGVLFYELLTRRKPFDFTGLSAGQVERLITQVPPIAPSESMEKAGGPDARARARQLRGDLDGIVLRCMKKAPNERYASVEQLVADIGNYLEGRPVQARGGHRWYRAQKFVRRNLLPVSAVALAVVALVGGAAAFAWQAREAQQRAAELEQVTEFQSQMLEALDPAAAGKLLVEDTVARYEKALATQDTKPAEKDARIAAFRDAWEMVNATDASRSLIDAILLKPAVAAVEKQFANQPAIDARLSDSLASRYNQIGMGRAALPLSQRVVDKYRAAFGPDDRRTMLSQKTLGLSHMYAGDYETAEPMLRDSLDHHLRVRGPDDPETLQAMTAFALVLWDLGQLDETAPLIEAVHEKAPRVFGPEHPRTLNAVTNMGTLRTSQGRPAEGVPFLRESLEKRTRLLGADDPLTLESLNYLAGALRDSGDASESEAKFRDLIERRRRVLGDDHPDTAMARSNLGGVLLEGHNALAAEPQYRAAHATIVASFGPDHAYSMIVANGLGSALVELGRNEEALAVLAPTLAPARALFVDTESYRLSRILQPLGRAQAGMGQFAEAEASLLEAQRLNVEHPGPRAARAAQRLAEALVALYTSWEGAEPGVGHAAKADEWRQQAQATASKG